MTNCKNRLDQLREECAKFHADHPVVWELFVKFTFDRIAEGFKHYGARDIMGRIRWETDQASVDTENSFKINDHFFPFYARRFHKMYPEHDGFFRTRRQISQDAPVSTLPPLGPRDF